MGRVQRPCLLPTRRDVLEDRGAVGPDPQHAVHEVGPSLKGPDCLADDPKLLIAHKIPVLDEDDAGVNLACAGELEEVGHVASYNDAIVGVRSFENCVIGRFEETSISNVNRVDAISLAERFGDGGGQVLIEQ